ncbi:hypothetical protein GF406_25945 [candidate division KSB1 bacterium]|nr:hypothetical protein [candidate division KSB1 bacterium]
MLSAQPGVEQNIRTEFEQHPVSQYFEFKEFISLDKPGLLIGELSDVFITANGLIIGDRKSDAILYLDKVKNRVQLLSVEEIQPGHHFRLKAFTAIDSNRYIIASDPHQYFIFDGPKVVESFALHEFFTPHTMTCFRDTLYLFTQPGPGKAEVFVVPLAEKTSHSFELQDYAPDLSRLVFRNKSNKCFLVDTSGWLYITSGYENKIYRYDHTGNLTDLVIINKNRFNTIKDTNANTPFSPSGTRQPHDFLFSVFLVQDRWFLSTFSDDKKIYTDLLTTTGQSLFPHPLPLWRPIRAVHGTDIYFEQPHREIDGKIKNPGLVVCRLKREVLN